MLELLDNDGSVGVFLVVVSVVKTVLLLRNGLSNRSAMAMASSQPGERKLVGKVTKLVIYPVKSTSGLEVQELNCTAEGASTGQFYDRQFMVTSGPEHSFLTARVVPRLVLIQPKLEGSKLKLEAPEMSSITVKVDDVVKRKDIRHTAVHGGVTKGLDCGNEVADWLNKFLKRSDCRLLYAAPSVDKRSVNGGSVKYAAWTRNIPQEHKMNYQDSTPYHLVSEASLSDLNTKLSLPLTTDNFRANIIVSGSKAFTEDTWNKIFIGETEMSIVKLCGRCVVTNIDPKSAEKMADNEPLKSLRSYRKLVPLFGDSPCLGINLNIERVGRVKAGDNVYAVIGSPKLAPDS